MRSLLTITFCLLALPLAATGQEVSGSSEASMSLWAASEDHYRHALSAEGDATLRWKALRATAYGHLKMWGGARTRFDTNAPSPLTAEWRKVIGRSHGAYLGVALQSWTLAALLHRSAVQHVWQHKMLEDRHNYFPIQTDWKGAVERCKTGREGKASQWADGTCPSLGYWEAVGARVAYEGDRYGVRVSYLPIRYKTLTLPPSVVLWSGQARLWDGVQVETEGEVDAQGNVFYDLSLHKRLIGFLWTGVRYGRISAPDWTQTITRWSFVMSIR